MNDVDDVEMTDLTGNDINASTLNKDLEGEGSQSKSSDCQKSLFVWGNTVNGELGLGGIEEHFIADPRRLEFSTKVASSTMISNFLFKTVIFGSGKLFDKS